MKKGCYASALVLLLGGCGGSGDSNNSDSDGVIPSLSGADHTRSLFMHNP